MCTSIKSTISTTVFTSMCKRKHDECESVMKRIKLECLNKHIKDSEECETHVKRIKFQCLNEHIKELWGSCENIHPKEFCKSVDLLHHEDKHVDLIGKDICTENNEPWIDFHCGDNCSKSLDSCTENGIDAIDKISLRTRDEDPFAKETPDTGTVKDAAKYGSITSDNKLEINHDIYPKDTIHNTEKNVVQSIKSYHNEKYNDTHKSDTDENKESHVSDADECIVPPTNDCNNLIIKDTVTSVRPDENNKNAELLECTELIVKVNDAICDLTKSTTSCENNDSDSTKTSEKRESTVESSELVTKDVDGSSESLIDDDDKETKKSNHENSKFNEIKDVDLVNCVHDNLVGSSCISDQVKYKQKKLNCLNKSHPIGNSSSLQNFKKNKDDNKKGYGNDSEPDKTNDNFKTDSESNTEGNNLTESDTEQDHEFETHTEINHKIHIHVMKNHEEHTSVKDKYQSHIKYGGEFCMRKEDTLKTHTKWNSPKFHSCSKDDNKNKTNKNDIPKFHKKDNGLSEPNTETNTTSDTEACPDDHSEIQKSQLFQLLVGEDKDFHLHTKNYDQTEKSDQQCSFDNTFQPVFQPKQSKKHFSNSLECDTDCQTQLNENVSGKCLEENNKVCSGSEDNISSPKHIHNISKNDENAVGSQDRESQVQQSSVISDMRICKKDRAICVNDNVDNGDNSETLLKNCTKHTTNSENNGLSTKQNASVDCGCQYRACNDQTKQCSPEHYSNINDSRHKIYPKIKTTPHTFSGALCGSRKPQSCNCDIKDTFLRSLLHKTEEKIRKVIEGSMFDSDVIDANTVIKIEDDEADTGECNMVDNAETCTGSSLVIDNFATHILPNKGNNDQYEVLDLRCKNKSPVSVGLDLRLDNKKKQGPESQTSSSFQDKLSEKGNESGMGTYEHVNGLYNSSSKKIDGVISPLEEYKNYTTPTKPYLRATFSPYDKIHPAFGLNNYSNTNTIRNSTNTKYYSQMTSDKFESSRDSINPTSPLSINDNDRRKGNQNRDSQRLSGGVLSGNIERRLSDVTGVSRRCSDKFETLRRHSEDIGRDRMPSSNFSSNKLDSSTKTNLNPVTSNYINSPQYTNDIDSPIRRLSNDSDSLRNYRSPSEELVISIDDSNDESPLDDKVSDKEFHMSGGNTVFSRPPPLIPISSLTHIREMQNRQEHHERDKYSSSNFQFDNEVHNMGHSKRNHFSSHPMKKLMLASPNRAVVERNRTNTWEKLRLTTPSHNKIEKNRKLVQKDLASGRNHTRMPSQSFLLFKQVQKRLKAITADHKRKVSEKSNCKCDNSTSSPFLKSLLLGQLSFKDAFHFHTKEVTKSKETSVENGKFNQQPDNASQCSPSSETLSRPVTKTPTGNKNCQSMHDKPPGLSYVRNTNVKKVHSSQNKPNVENSSILTPVNMNPLWHSTMFLPDLHKNPERHRVYNNAPLNNPNLNQLQMTADKVFQAQKQNGYMSRTSAVLNSEAPSKNNNIKNHGVEKNTSQPSPLYFPHSCLPQHQFRHYSPLDNGRQFPNMAYYKPRPWFGQKSSTVSKPPERYDSAVNVNFPMSRDFYGVNRFTGKVGIIPTNLQPPLIPLECLKRK